MKLIRDILTEREVNDGAKWKSGFDKKSAQKELLWLSPYIKSLKRIANGKH